MDPEVGKVLTFIQFLFISIVGLCDQAINGSLLRSKVPIRKYVEVTILFWIVSVATNYSFAFGVSQPFAVVFRSSSLLVSFLIGFFIYKKRYSFLHFVASILVTLGVIITTSAEVSQKRAHDNSTFATMTCANCNDMTAKTNNAVYDYFSKSLGYEFFDWIIGTMLLFISLLLLAVLGHMQGSVYEKHGRYPEEMLFYSHFIPLPCFLLFYREFPRHFKVWTASPLTPFLPIPIPIMWMWVCCNAVTQYICLRGVHSVTATFGTLTCTFWTTVRKFLTLIFSILYFQNAFTWVHWFGSFLVLVGSLLFIGADWQSEGKKKKE
jgi:UDP-xylose/UDP-N-acetylglucosamine transporter B4